MTARPSRSSRACSRTPCSAARRRGGESSEFSSPSPRATTDLGSTRQTTRHPAARRRRAEGRTEATHVVPVSGVALCCSEESDVGSGDPRWTEPAIRCTCARRPTTRAGPAGFVVLQACRLCALVARRWSSGLWLMSCPQGQLGSRRYSLRGPWASDYSGFQGSIGRVGEDSHLPPKRTAAPVRVRLDQCLKLEGDFCAPR